MKCCPAEESGGTVCALRLRGQVRVPTRRHASVCDEAAGPTARIPLSPWLIACCWSQATLRRVTGGNHTKATIGSWSEPLPRHNEVSEMLARTIIKRARKALEED